MRIQQILGGNLGGSLLSILGVFLVAGFSFQGTELIGITAPWNENPATRKTPRIDNKLPPKLPPRIGPSPFVNVSKPTNSPPIIPNSRRLPSCWILIPRYRVNWYYSWRI
jgi:hypothetical protein